MIVEHWPNLEDGLLVVFSPKASAVGMVQVFFKGGGCEEYVKWKAAATMPADAIVGMSTELWNGLNAECVGQSLN